MDVYLGGEKKFLFASREEKEITPREQRYALQCIMLFLPGLQTF